MLDHREIAIEIYNEIVVCRELLKIRIADKLNYALDLLTVDEALKYIYETDTQVQDIAESLNHNMQLFEEHLDAMLPINEILEQIYTS
jgi:thioester reductase-like protein